MDKTIIFVHLFKCGGTSLASWVWTRWDLLRKDTRRICRLGVGLEHPEHYNNRSDKDRNNIRFITGHFHGACTLNDAYKMAPTSPTFITQLRDPVERAISAYYNLKEQPDARGFYEDIKANSFSEVHKRGNYNCDRFSSKVVLFDMFNNYQTRVLSGQALYSGEDIRDLTEKDLEKAKSKLEKYFSYIGIVENSDKLWQELSRRFGWDEEPHPAIMCNGQDSNKGKIRPANISAEELSLVSSMNQFDIELYKWAKENAPRINSRPIPEITDESIC